MYTILPETDEAWALAAKVVERGDLAVFPTDTVYGIGCNPYDAAALERIYVAKGRPIQKAIPLLLSDATDITTVAGELTESAKLLGQHLWPGALTLVVQRNSALPVQVGSANTVAVRVPNHQGLRGLIARCGGALAATSANRSGEPDALDVSEAVQYLGDHVQLFVDGGRSPGNKPSTVVDCTVEPPRILREGAADAAEIEALLGKVTR
jgi:L-threonylcarbamoyladenylate synthase